MTSAQDPISAQDRRRKMTSAKDQFSAPRPAKRGEAAEPKARRVRGGLVKRSALLALVLAACTPKPPVQRPYAAPTAAELSALLAARAKAVRGMNARARATSWLGGERVRATVLMLVERDGHLRIEAEVSLQGTVAALATDGTRFALLDVQHNQLSRGPACPANVASLVRIPLAPAEVAAVLLGDVRLPADATPAAEVAWDATRGADVLEFSTRAGVVRAFFARHGTAVDLVGAEAVAAGKRQWRTSYEDFSAQPDGTRLPSTIRFAERDGSYDDGVEIKVKDRKLNEPAPEGAFTLAPPPGAAVRDVGCGG
jgi:Domain of unknown function (DUF4292)